ncbi:ABC-type multidrug transport system, ATPase and permease component [Pleurocapsa sp. PCC 7327]|uniref:ABC transporter ATP-binding protein n=1 Tax=Pleurocapsa sp. PCC 7327 TaxID=118163 RepID=UPI00029FAD50|nr:ABC transporter ATP-binding protein [Pleurocapsa sp. PCC 7327]AFY75949.1 ABC-type multidrug transport system, ATPase and permease component [Pleurocapsa sp. PCC 7327]
MASFRDILGYFRKYRAIALFSIAASSFFELVDLVVPYAIGQILNVLSNQPLDRPLQNLVAQVAFLTQRPEDRFLSLGVLLGLIFLVTVVRAPIQPWLSAWFHWDIALRTRRDHLHKVIAKILTLPLSFYDENNPGRIASRIARGIENHTWTYPEVAGQFIPKMARILGIFVVIWVIEWRIAIAFFISFLLILAFILKDLNRLIKKEEVLDRHMENTQSRTSEIITNIKTVKAFATEAYELDRQKQRLERESNYVIYRIHKGYVDLLTWQKTIVQLSVFLVLLFTLISTVQGHISIGHFITTLTISSMAYSELDPISQMAEIFARRYASMIRLHEFMKLPAGRDAASLLPESIDSNPYKFTGKVELRHLTFGYHPNRPILKDINLLIEPYQTVALVGRSGSGKSTLVKLLFRYFEPNQGGIFIDGENIRTLDTAGYRRRLAIVHQEVDIFNGTLLDNLTYGNRKISFEQIEKACRIARVDEFIHDLPKGYNTIVGERGVRLSGGQRQRLGIARALIVDPDVLVFDEATSSLDYESERSIQLAMRSIFGTRTTIIIAHRLSTIREADKIVVLDSGRIVEVGNHDELLNQQGIYHRLHSLQETGELLD